MSNVNPAIVDGLIGQAYSSVRYANMIPKTLDKARTASQDEFLQLLKNQIKIIQSEVNETVKAIEEKDAVEILDGGCDMLVTTMGFLQILQERCQAREALLEVTANNLTKFVSVFDPNLDQIVNDTIAFYAEKGVKVTAVLNNALSMYAFMDEEGKYKKPCTYKNVELISHLGGINV